MQKKLLINMLINWHKENTTERILWLDWANETAILIDVFENVYSPKSRNILDICDGLDYGNAVIIDKDPYAIIYKEEEIKEKYKHIRDKAWEVISFILIKCKEPNIYNPAERRKYILEASNFYNVSEKMIYIYLQKYWQRGRTINSLLPDYINCGQKGKDKQPGLKKRGRPRKDSETGINVDDKTKKIFRLAIKKYYITTKENSLQTAYELMRKTYYTDGTRNDNGILKPTLLKSGQTPSYGQFRYWYLKERDIKREVAGRKSLKRYFLENREVLGSTSQDSIGPGSMWQIDATIANLYLVSRYDRNQIIGRPVVYSVVDVYSHAITGLLVTLENPSWSSAMMALSNATVNKVEFCSKYGITITENEWPIHNCICETILADRGEFEGNCVEGMIEGLGIRVSNTASNRGDSKGIVERLFHTLDTIVKPHVPAVVGTDFAMRGAKDYRVEAKLDIHQFTAILIKIVLYLNNHHYMDNYIREAMMIEDGVEPIPTKIWNWGIINKSGSLRYINQDIVRLNLMPRDLGTVTGKGIKFKGVYYYSESSLKEHWFVRAKNNGRWKRTIAYDPQCLDNIYILQDDGKSFETAYLLEREDRYKNKSLDEIEYLLEYEKKKSQDYQDKKLQAKSDMISDIEAIVKDANRQTDAVLDRGISKSKRIKGIRNNRVKEKIFNREEEYDKTVSKSRQKGKLEEYSNIIVEDYVEDDLNIIKSLQREVLNSEKFNTD